MLPWPFGCVGLPRFSSSDLNNNNQDNKVYQKKLGRGVVWRPKLITYTQGRQRCGGGTS